MTHDWPDDLVRVIVAEVRRHRENQKLTTQELADRLVDLGLPTSRSMLANLESGRRATVSVPELLAFAAALGVPPAALLFPFPRHNQSPPVVTGPPGIPADPIDAIAWLSDLALLIDATPPTNMSDTQLYQAHRVLTVQWPHDEDPPAGTGDEPLLRARIEIERYALLQLQEVRAVMRNRWLVPPPLSDVLARATGEAR